MIEYLSSGEEVSRLLYIGIVGLMITNVALIAVVLVLAKEVLGERREHDTSRRA